MCEILYFTKVTKNNRKFLIIQANKMITIYLYAEAKHFIIGVISNLCPV
jgi:hypothetical protein